MHSEGKVSIEAQKLSKINLKSNFQFFDYVHINAAPPTTTALFLQITIVPCPKVKEPQNAITVS